MFCNSAALGNFTQGAELAKWVTVTQGPYLFKIICNVDCIQEVERLDTKEDGPWNRTFVSNIWGYSFRISRMHRGIPQPAVIHKQSIVFFLGQFRSGLDCSSSDM